jgi:hypothetical protein
MQQYESNAEFLEFLNRRFNETAAGATLEELAEFDFGSFDNAVGAFENFKGLKQIDT